MIFFIKDNRSYRSANAERKEAIDNLRSVLNTNSKTIKMYRSVPSNVKENFFRNGDWITPSRSYAIDNAKVHGWGNDYRIIENVVSVEDIWTDGNDIAGRLYSLQNIERLGASARVQENNFFSSVTNTPSHVDNVSQLFNIVKNKDDSFKPKKVNPNLPAKHKK